MAVHPDLVSAQPGIILHQVRPVKGGPAVDDDDSSLGALILGHLAYVAGYEVLQLPRAEAYSEDQCQKNARCDEILGLAVLK